MKRINISEVRSHLTSVIEDVLATHEQVVVTRYGAPLVAITPFQDPESVVNRYPLRGHPVMVAKDFDEPLPDLWEALSIS